MKTVNSQNIILLFTTLAITTPGVFSLNLKPGIPSTSGVTRAITTQPDEPKDKDKPRSSDVGLSDLSGPLLSDVNDRHSDQSQLSDAGSDDADSGSVTQTDDATLSAKTFCQNACKHIVYALPQLLYVISNFVVSMIFTFLLKGDTVKQGASALASRALYEHFMGGIPRGLAVSLIKVYIFFFECAFFCVCVCVCRLKLS